MVIRRSRVNEEVNTLFALLQISILEGDDWMPAYKDKATDTWFVKFYSKDWKGTGRAKTDRSKGVDLKQKKRLLILREISKCGRNVIWIWHSENFSSCIQMMCRTG